MSLKIIDAYILRESTTQFVSTLIVFCAVIVISQLVRLSEVLVAFGLTLENIFLPFLYIIVPFLPVIMPMAIAFGMMVTFARLSSDGEHTALLAAGYPLRRMVMPILLLASTVYLATTFCALNLEAWGRREFVQFIYRKTQTELDNIVRYKIQPGVFLADFLGYVLYTEGVGDNRRSYSNVMLAPGRQSSGDFVLFAPRASILGTVESGDLRMKLFDGVSFSSRSVHETSTLRFEQAEIDLLRMFQGKILGDDSAKDDYRSYTFSQLGAYVSKLRARPNYEADRVYLKAYYLYVSRFANPFLVFALCLFGVMLGIQEQRRGKGGGYAGAIAAVIGSFVLVVAGRWAAEQGHLPVILGASAPPLMTLLLSLFLFRQRNRLPPAESVWNIRFWPIFSRFFSGGTS